MDDYGNDMNVVADSWSMDVENTLLRWMIDGMPGEFSELFLMSAKAV